MIVFTLLVGLLSGCGGDTPDAAPSGTPAGYPATTSQSDATAYFQYVIDSYGLQRPNFLHVSNSGLGLVMRAEVAAESDDLWFDTNILRIECPYDVSIGSYTLGESNSACRVMIFNGQQRASIKVTAGSLEVTEAGSHFSGSFEVLFIDYEQPLETYNWLSASFSARVGYSGPTASASRPIPEEAGELFALHCEMCHEPQRLNLSGYLLSELFATSEPHQDVVLSDQELYMLKVLLNAPAEEAVSASL